MARLVPVGDREIKKSNTHITVAGCVQGQKKLFERQKGKKKAKETRDSWTKEHCAEEDTVGSKRGDIAGCVYLHVCMHRAASQNPDRADILEVVLALGT